VLVVAVDALKAEYARAYASWIIRSPTRSDAPAGERVEQPRRPLKMVDDLEPRRRPERLVHPQQSQLPLVLGEAKRVAPA
jgi:hypothetical protein